MPRNVEIGIFLIAHTELKPKETRQWLDFIGATDFDVKGPAIDHLIELAGRRCYMSFQPGLNPNVTKIRTDLTEYLDNILKSRHGSVLEHATYTFAIENVSRVFTGEMNRHRAGWAISEGSMRYIRFDDMAYWVPISLRPVVGNSDEVSRKMIESQEVFRKAFADAEKHYTELQKIWKDELAPESKFHAKKQITSMMRRIVPMGIATGGIWTGNVRALRHVLEMRCSPAAEEEICYVFSIIMKMIAEKDPNLFGDFQQIEGGFYVPKYSKV